MSEIDPRAVPLADLLTAVHYRPNTSTEVRAALLHIAAFDFLHDATPQPPAPAAEPGHKCPLASVWNCQWYDAVSACHRQGCPDHPPNSTPQPPSTGGKDRRKLDMGGPPGNWETLPDRRQSKARQHILADQASRRSVADHDLASVNRAYQQAQTAADEMADEANRQEERAQFAEARITALEAELAKAKEDSFLADYMKLRDNYDAQTELLRAAEAELASARAQRDEALLNNASLNEANLSLGRSIELAHEEHERLVKAARAQLSGAEGGRVTAERLGRALLDQNIVGFDVTLEEATRSAIGILDLLGPLYHAPVPPDAGLREALAKSTTGLAIIGRVHDGSVQAAQVGAWFSTEADAAEFLRRAREAKAGTGGEGE